jgi:hypothetical protein
MLPDLKHLQDQVVDNQELNEAKAENKLSTNTKKIFTLESRIAKSASIRCKLVSSF